MMNLYFDMQGAQTEGSRRRGIGRYTRDLANALIKASGPRLRSLDLAWNTALHCPLPELNVSCGEGFVVSSPYGAMTRPRFTHDFYDLHQCINDRLLRHSHARSRCDHILFSSLMETEEVDFVLPQTLNFGPLATSYAIVYDIIPWLYPNNYLPDPGRLQQYKAHLNVKLSADVLFSISEYTRQDLIRHLKIAPDRVYTIGSGIDLAAFQGSRTPRDEFLTANGLYKPFLFFLGGDEFRKNLGGFVEALLRLPQDYKQGLQVLIAGRVTENRKNTFLSKLYDGGWPEDSLRFVDFMSEPDLLQAYSACAMTVVPSIYEGFGLPVLEAMACEAPVIASGNSSMSEILKTEAFLFDGNNPDDIANKIIFVLQNPEAVAQLKKTYAAILAGHSWQKVVERTLDAFAQESEKKQRAHIWARQLHAPRPLDIAFWGNPPQVGYDLVDRLCAANPVMLYADKAHMADLANSPCPVLDLKSLHRDQSRSTPVISLVTTADGLTALLALSAASENLLVVPQGLLDSLSERADGAAKRLKEALPSFHNIWILNDEAITPSIPAGQTEKGELRFSPLSTSFDLSSDCLLHLLGMEIELFETSNPRQQANEFKDLLEKFGKAASFSKPVSELASISRFERRIIPSQEPQTV